MAQMLAPKSITINTTNLPFGVIQAVLAAPIKANLKASTDTERQALRKALTPGQRMALGVIGLEREVQSGGFDAYFRYSEAWWCADALEGLHEIGATRHLAVLKKAVAVLTPGTLPRSVSRRERLLDTLTPAKEARLDDLSGTFYDAYTGVEQLSLGLIQLMAAHPEDFFRHSR